jgi:hypothetical protein
LPLAPVCRDLRELALLADREHERCGKEDQAGNCPPSPFPAQSPGEECSRDGSDAPDDQILYRRRTKPAARREHRKRYGRGPCRAERGTTAAREARRGFGRFVYRQLITNDSASPRA